MKILLYNINGIHTLTILTPFLTVSAVAACSCTAPTIWSICVQFSHVYLHRQGYCIHLWGDGTHKVDYITINDLKLHYITCVVSCDVWGRIWCWIFENTVNRRKLLGSCELWGHVYAVLHVSWRLIRRSRTGRNEH